MQIIKNTARGNGSYPTIQSWDLPTIPDGYCIWPDTLNTDDFYAYNGFVILTISDNTVESYMPNVEAWESWNSSLPPDPEPEPTDTEVLNTLLGVI